MKRKYYILLLALPILAFFSFSDEAKKVNLADNEFKVITVRGEIVFEKSGENMKRGDLYVKGTPLSFASNESRASVYNSNQGRYVLSGNTRGKLKILPATNNISTRSGALLNLVDLKNHFDGRYLIIKRQELQINQEAFPMNEDSFFYLKYEHQGELIPKKLRFEGDYLILDKEEIFKIDGEAIPIEEKEMTLYYRGAEKTLKINKFTPVFPDEEELKEEVGLILELRESDKTYEEKYNEGTSYLNEFYGRPYKPNLQDWLKVEFNLTDNKK